MSEPTRMKRKRERKKTCRDKRCQQIFGRWKAGGRIIRAEKFEYHVFTQGDAMESRANSSCGFLARHKYGRDWGLQKTRMSCRTGNLAGSAPLKTKGSVERHPKFPPHSIEPSDHLSPPHSRRRNWGSVPRSARMVEEGSTRGRTGRWRESGSSNGCPPSPRHHVLQGHWQPNNH